MTRQFGSLAITGRIAAAVAVTAALALGPFGEGRAEAPARVVSMNLCVDQLALLLAAPGQLVSVFRWSARDEASNLAAEARALPLNDGSAERVFALKPDLVLAGAFSDQHSVAMLRRLGIAVEVFPPANSLDDVRATIRGVGAALGRDAAAADMIAALDAALAEAARSTEGLGREAAAYHYANSYTAGRGTLANDLMLAAGLDNAAAALGLRGTVQIPLEVLVMQQPFLIETRHIGGETYGRAFENRGHPALRALRASRAGATVEDRWQVCGTPFLLRAVEALIEARLKAR